MHIRGNIVFLKQTNVFLLLSTDEAEVEKGFLAVIKVVLLECAESDGYSCMIDQLLTSI